MNYLGKIRKLIENPEIHGKPLRGVFHGYWGLYFENRFSKTQEFLQKLAPCIARGDLDAWVEEAARVAHKIGGGETVRSNLPYLTSSF